MAAKIEAMQAEAKAMAARAAQRRSEVARASVEYATANDKFERAQALAVQAQAVQVLIRRQIESTLAPLVSGLQHILSDHSPAAAAGAAAPPSAASSAAASARVELDFEDAGAEPRADAATHQMNNQPSAAAAAAAAAAGARAAAEAGAGPNSQSLRLCVPTFDSACVVWRDFRSQRAANWRPTTQPAARLLLLFFFGVFLCGRSPALTQSNLCFPFSVAPQRLYPPASPPRTLSHLHL